MDILRYLFYPNPGSASYGNPKVLALAIICGCLVLASFALKTWRKRQRNPVTRRLSRSWSRAVFWFGIVGLVLVVARVEPIQYVAMRFWWFVWVAAFLLYIVVQVRLFRARHYTVVTQEKTLGSDDPRERYLPRKKSR